MNIRTIAIAFMMMTNTMGNTQAITSDNRPVKNIKADTAVVRELEDIGTINSSDNIDTQINMTESKKVAPSWSWMKDASRVEKGNVRINCTESILK